MAVSTGAGRVSCHARTLSLSLWSPLERGWGVVRNEKSRTGNQVGKARGGSTATCCVTSGRTCSSVPAPWSLPTPPTFSGKDQITAGMQHAQRRVASHAAAVGAVQAPTQVTGSHISGTRARNSRAIWESVKWLHLLNQTLHFSKTLGRSYS